MNSKFKDLPSFEQVYLIVFDFDGIFTDNKVYVNNHGYEFVCCDRADGLAFDLLRNFIKQKNLKLHYFILSKEVNSVVETRAKKLKVPCFHGVDDKEKFLNEYIKEKEILLSSEGKNFLYLGNDLNDLSSMKMSDFSIAPIDAHPIVKNIADLVLASKGGQGFVREFIEKLLQIDCMEVEDIIELLKN